MTGVWTPAQVAAIGARACAPLIARDAPHPLPGYDLWDYWPAQRRDGTVASIAGGELHFFLSAPAGPDPEDRHALARIRLLWRRDGLWRDLGDALPDGWSPGSREWSGSAVVDADGGALTLHFTAAGHRGEAAPTFDQRLFATRARIDAGGATPVLRDWSAPRETLVADGAIYARDMTGGGGIGTIKAFRDPYVFRDPATGVDHLLFAASLAGSRSAWNGAVGIADWDGDRWRARPPLLSADGLNNELERPHVIVHHGRYLLFWSTQSAVFAPAGPIGPTGLYGMTASGLAGPWTPLNGDALVFANPAAAPRQAYSWQVLPDLRVLGFADRPGLARPPRDIAEARAYFAGRPAPDLRLAIDGDRVTLA